MNTRQTLLEKITEELQQLDDATLLEEYVAVRTKRASESPPPRVPPKPPAERAINTKPGSTISIVFRIFDQAKRPMAVRDVINLAHRENRAITPAMVRGAISRLSTSGYLDRVGPGRSGTYKLNIPE